jgi:hypothetical protein
MTNPLEQRIFKTTSSNFQDIALEVFCYQAASNRVYADYLNLLKIVPQSITTITGIPFLPISFFKTHRVIVDGKKAESTFISSGTTGSETSKHHVASLQLYERSFLGTFQKFYGIPSDYCILALLPSYLEREGSSLIYMVNKLIEESKHPQSGFYLEDYKQLVDVLLEQEKNGQKTILLGVTYALLELANNYKLKLSNTIIMETGGMKGRGKELVRKEVHHILREAFGVKVVHSEYGMTELHSQAYSLGNGIFQCPQWMLVFCRDPYDPFTILPQGRTGALNIIDLANLYSCSFIQTDDLGTVFSDGTFEVIGRMDGSQIRGCNLLVYQ